MTSFWDGITPAELKVLLAHHKRATPTASALSDNGDDDVPAPQEGTP